MVVDPRQIRRFNEANSNDTLIISLSIYITKKYIKGTLICIFHKKKYLATYSGSFPHDITGSVLTKVKRFPSGRKERISEELARTNALFLQLIVVLTLPSLCAATHCLCFKSPFVTNGSKQKTLFFVEYLKTYFHFRFFLFYVCYSKYTV